MTSEKIFESPQTMRITLLCPRGGPTKLLRGHWKPRDRSPGEPSENAQRRRRSSRAGNAHGERCRRRRRRRRHGHRGDTRCDPRGDQGDAHTTTLRAISTTNSFRSVSASQRPNRKERMNRRRAGVVGTRRDRGCPTLSATDGPTRPGSRHSLLSASFPSFCGPASVLSHNAPATLASRALQCHSHNKFSGVLLRS